MALYLCTLRVSRLCLNKRMKIGWKDIDSFSLDLVYVVIVVTVFFRIPLFTTFKYLLFGNSAVLQSKEFFKRTSGS